MKSIGIAGGGLVGSLLSIFLARRGISSDVYEFRSDLRSESAGSGRSINLAISVRGLYALRQVGLEEEVLKLAIPMRGRMIHSLEGETHFQSYGLADSDCIYSISRLGLNQVLLAAAEKTGQVRLQFGKKVTAIDWSREVAGSPVNLTLLDRKSGVESHVHHSTVIAADGSASVIRNSLTQAPGYCTQEVLEYGYKEMTIPAGPNQSFLLDERSLHIWPRGDFMLIALPNLDGSFTCTLFMPFRGEKSFERLGNPEAVDSFFKAQFSDIRKLIPDLETSFFTHPTGKMVTVKCQPWSYSDQVLLIGDAAHAIVPFFGQGMNCGFEDCTVLDELLSREENWEKAFEEFSVQRKKDSDKIADMAVENFVEMRAKVADPKFLLQKEVEKVLQKEFPGQYLSRYFLVSFSRFPYSKAYQVGLLQNEILDDLCANISDPPDVDLVHARTLIQDRLLPWMGDWNQI